MSVMPVGASYEQINEMPYSRSIEALSLVKVQPKTWEIKYRIDRSGGKLGTSRDIQVKTVWASGDSPHDAWSNVMKSEGY